METKQTFIDFLREQSGKILEQTLVHLGLTFSALLLALVIGLSLGILISFQRRLAALVLGIAGILQTIPSIALLGFMIPLLGIGAQPAIAALLLYALLPIIRNTYTGITQIDPAITEAALALGMNPRQVLMKVQLPLAMPVILAGIRIAAVITVGVATLAAYIAAGGLGEFIFGGIALNNTHMILAGAIPAAVLALLCDGLLSLIQKLSARRLRHMSWLLPCCLIVLSSALLAPATFDRKMLAGFTPEFMGRQDGFLGLQKVYGLTLRTVVINDMIMYKAIAGKKLDLISGSTTDGRVKAYDLLALEDDKHIFPPYYAAPLVHHKTLEKYPQLTPVLNMLAGRIDDSTMTALNYQVDYLKQSPEQVALDFLKQNNLYRPPSPSKTGDNIIIGSKLFGDGYILAAMYKILVEGYTSLNVTTKTGLGGTQICFEALANGQIDLYPEYTGTGLMVILKTPKAVTDTLLTNPGKVYAYVKEAFHKQYGLDWMLPIGFNNTYAVMMRRSQADSLGIHSLSALKSWLNKNPTL
ncbi:ABC transporter permease/substrate-binding protein [Filimonas effusa]|uniref:ABC transporter permease subunit n=1 Tax=Filimonas effusa TaxID=2508721 RepID=A0A4Q1D9T9_9BACT|nr:ABC transporter permease/substrate-binding protein [Filimonas effusa]RXK86131.1 ABC transporter permease subunit [Filimonas effusa]